MRATIYFTGNFTVETTEENLEKDIDKALETLTKAGLGDVSVDEVETED